MTCANDFIPLERNRAATIICANGMLYPSMAYEHAPLKSPTKLHLRQWNPLRKNRQWRSALQWRPEGLPLAHAATETLPAFSEGPHDEADGG